MTKEEYYQIRSKNTRLVETELQGSDQFQILESVLGQLSDGFGENNPYYENRWVFAEILLNPCTNKVEIRISNELCTKSNYYPNRWIWNPYKEESDLEIRKYFAKKIKTIVNLEAKDLGKKIEFKLGNYLKLNYLGDWTQDVNCAVEVYNKLIK